MILCSILQESIDRLTTIAVASEDAYSYPDPEILSLATNKIGTFITQLQLFLKNFCYSGSDTDIFLELYNHFNNLFTQSGAVISYLDIFHLFSIVDVLALTAKPLDGNWNGLAQM